ncbi:hypothetical protein BESB_059930 [Besnoitia besnoiti]|uniref:Uncharacterized protein n=1 Tax=Besnoitia besnoiti TaxID=94643 RepID=A0A2A9MGK7_BESBE|nr:hypothetical protein BESB_059930 [Besnoitia besnoiti]PFH35106.1 hypothetical protein BESB_059930 [Besnoitia besnoiti]
MFSIGASPCFFLRLHANDQGQCLQDIRCLFLSLLVRCTRPPPAAAMSFEGLSKPPSSAFGVLQPLNHIYLHFGFALSLYRVSAPPEFLCLRRKPLLACLLAAQLTGSGLASLPPRLPEARSTNLFSPGAAVHPAFSSHGTRRRGRGARRPAGGRGASPPALFPPGCLDDPWARLNSSLQQTHPALELPFRKWSDTLRPQDSAAEREALGVVPERENGDEPNERDAAAACGGKKFLKDDEEGNGEERKATGRDAGSAQQAGRRAPMRPPPVISEHRLGCDEEPPRAEKEDRESIGGDTCAGRIQDDAASSGDDSSYPPQGPGSGTLRASEPPREAHSPACRSPEKKRFCLSFLPPPKSGVASSFLSSLPSPKDASSSFLSSLSRPRDADVSSPLGSSLPSQGAPVSYASCLSSLPPARGACVTASSLLSSLPSPKSSSSASVGSPASPRRGRGSSAHGAEEAANDRDEGVPVQGIATAEIERESTSELPSAGRGVGTATAASVIFAASSVSCCLSSGAGVAEESQQLDVAEVSVPELKPAAPAPCALAPSGDMAERAGEPVERPGDSTKPAAEGKSAFLCLDAEKIREKLRERTNPGRCKGRGTTQ